MSRKVVLLGIDGADWDFIDKWIEQGFLPNLKKSIDLGFRSPLKAAMPLNSAASWTTIVTGRSPAEHGVFGFVRESGSGYLRRLISSDDVGAATLWETVNAAGQKAGIVNCPITYPPRKIDGFMISGILIPYNDLWAYPPDLEKMLRSRFGPYLVDVSWAMVDETKPGDREKFIADMYLMTRKQEEAALKCISETDCRILAIFFTGTDRIMHRFWHLTDPKHPLYDPASAKIYGDEIRKYFSLIDEVLGRLLGKIGDATVFVVSDHGFGPLYYRVYLRAWLAKNNYLVETDADSRIETDETLRGIDFSKTKAYPSSMSASGIWINLEGRQSSGIVSKRDYEKLRDEIISGLSDLLIDGGIQPVKRAIRREEILKGKYLGEAPDIFIEPNELFIMDDGKSEKLFDFSRIETGTHRTTGIFIASGDGIKHGAARDVLQTTDVLPTLLAAAELAVPDDLDGRVVEEIFMTPPKIKNCKPIPMPRKRPEFGIDDEDENRRNQLKGLGYI